MWYFMVGFVCVTLGLVIGALLSFDGAAGVRRLHDRYTRADDDVRQKVDALLAPKKG